MDNRDGSVEAPRRRLAVVAAVAGVAAAAPILIARIGWP